jgi:hypothetical protein
VCSSEVDEGRKSEVETKMIEKTCCCGSKSHSYSNDYENMILQLICNQCGTLTIINYGDMIVDWFNEAKENIKKELED